MKTGIGAADTDRVRSRRCRQEQERQIRTEIGAADIDGLRSSRYRRK